MAFDEDSIMEENCIVCGEPFERKTQRHVFCSDVCEALYRRRGAAALQWDMWGDYMHEATKFRNSRDNKVAAVLFQIGMMQKQDKLPFQFPSLDAYEIKQVLYRLDRKKGKVSYRQKKMIKELERRLRNELRKLNRESKEVYHEQ